jgi:hypothetical protein
LTLAERVSIPVSIDEDADQRRPGPAKDAAMTDTDRDGGVGD